MELEEHAEAAGDIEILRWARGALAEGGKREKAGLMERFIHVAELQQAGASGEQIGQAFEGLSMEMTIDLLEVAAGLYADWDMGERARACYRLARYYSDREEGHEHESEAENDHEHEELHEEHAEDAHRHQDYLILLQRLEDLQAELEEIRHLLHEQLER